MDQTNQIEIATIASAVGTALGLIVSRVAKEIEVQTVQGTRVSMTLCGDKIECVISDLL